MSEAPAQGYEPMPDTHDEAHDAGGEVRPSWQYMLGSLSSLGRDEISERQRRAMRLLRDDGATYTIYNAPRRDRIWSLDLIPWLIDSAEWQDIEAGLQERAEVFDLMLRDLYGQRELITRGIIPPEVIFGHNGFLRACQGLTMPGTQQLIIHAVDMVRADDGRMTILTDRTQAPSGAGYALENRTVMNRVLPSLFRDSHVHRLATYFQALRQTLIRLAPNVSQPEIAVLTPGAYNETYFEHAYLANYLGFRLVQASDLVVRNGYVWVKSLSSLTRLDVILRRVDDEYCDQVELKGDSELGIPGLLQVIRAGNVVVANPLGSGVLENPALLRYLPRISEHFLGRELRLRSVPTFWCGDPEDCEVVFERMDELVIKRVIREPEVTSQVGSDLGANDRETLRAAIRRNPGMYVAQEKLVPSHMPVYDRKAGNTMTGRPGILRTYACAYDGSYRVMPGGLTRVGASPYTTMISNQLGSVSKDTWIIASEPEKELSLLTPEKPVSESTGRDTLPGRVVDNLFWMARYGERTLNVLRLTRIVLVQLGTSHSLSGEARRHLLRTLTHFTMTYPGFVEDGDTRSEEEELVSLIRDESRTGSIAQVLGAMIVCAEQSRDLLSTDSQRIINDLTVQLRELDGLPRSELLSAPEVWLNSLVTSMLALNGILEESMQRGVGWRFYDTGLRVERTSQTLSLVLAALADPQSAEEEVLTLENLLLTFEGLMSFRRMDTGGISVPDVLGQVLQDSQNPRSVLYQLRALETHLAQMPNDEEGGLSAEQRTVLELISLVSLADTADLANVDEEAGLRLALQQFLLRGQQLVHQCSDALSDRYFRPTPRPSQLLDPNRGNR